ncbi:hypothetical protein [Nannocystis pusilla]|uniref:hypothetical protein n=1 Tax=Nannocystis pusilla TaxID=889268 RepID=UPI003B818C3C
MPTVTFYLWSAVAQHGGSLWLPGSLAELGAMVPAPTWRPRRSSPPGSDCRRCCTWSCRGGWCTGG